MTDQKSQPGWNASAPKRAGFNGRALLIIGLVVLLASFVLNRQTPTRAPVSGGVDGGAAQEPTTVQVIYELTGSARGADLTYTDASGNIQQQAGVAVPLKNTSGSSGIGFKVDRGSFVSFSAQNTGESGDLTCTIKAGGKVLNTGHSSGGFTIASCSARVP